MDDNTHIHTGLAEQGKLHAVAGEHSTALIYYREALRMVANSSAHEVYFRHYLECSLESLEILGAYNEVMAYCDKAIDFYQKFKTESAEKAKFIQVDVAHLHQRRGVILYKRGDKSGALEALQTAERLSRQNSIKLELTTSLLNWLRRGMHLDSARVLAEQNARHYFSVRRDTIRPHLAIRLTQAQLKLLQGVG